MSPDMTQSRNCSRIQKHPEALARLDVLLQERIGDPNIAVTCADKFHISFLDEPHVLPGRNAMGGGNGSYRDVNCVATAVSVFNQLTEFGSLFHADLSF